MKNFKMMIITLLVGAFTVSANAAIFNVGDYKLTSSIYIDTTSESAPGLNDTLGIGRVDSISSGGTTYWTAGTNGQYLNFNFSGYTLLSNIVAGSTNVFEATGGRVDFWLNDSTIFDANQSYLSQKAAQETGTLYIKTVASGITRGTSTLNNYNANGYLSVIGGLIQSTLDTNFILDFAGNPADMSFNITADTLATSGINQQYNYTGSSDGKGLVSTVPLPGSVWLMASGLIGLVSTQRRKV